MTVESCSYSLTLGGRAVGTQVLRTAVQNRVTRLESRALFQGVFGQHSLTQTSQLLTASGESLHFAEEQEGKNDPYSFEVAFDSKTGLIQASKRVGSHHERREIPYLRPYSDPLGLLQRLRLYTAQPDTLRRIPMLGKDVVFEPLGESVIETALGDKRVVGYILRPGPSYVYIETASPHTIVRLLQPSQHGLVEALLTRVTREAGELGAPKKPQGETRNKRRRRGGRRRRRVES